MTHSLAFLYDDRLTVSASVSNIVGDRRYGCIVFKRQSLHRLVKSELAAVASAVDFHHVTTDEAFEAAIANAEAEGAPLYYFPASVVPVAGTFAGFIDKLLLARQDTLIWVGRPLGIFVSSARRLGNLLKQGEDVRNQKELVVVEPTGLCFDIYDYQACLRFFSGGFETRYFNHLSGGDDILRKQSQNVAKLRAEFNGYYLLPPKTQRWFVQPFDFREDNGTASYSMERLMLPDVSLQWIHQAMTLPQFERLLDKAFLFLGERARRKIGRGEARKRRESVYVTKLKERFETLRQTDAYARIDAFVHHGTPYGSVQNLIDTYLRLYDAYTKRNGEDVMIIGHGDLCFSNMLYDKTINLLRLVDPKGAEVENDLWMDPYYDLAKLSHSILGNYDWLNNDLFTLSIDYGNRVALRLKTDETALAPFKQAFIDKVAEAGYDVFGVRLYEASLFLSMTPLHIDHEQKVLAQLLTAAHILEELKHNA